MAIPPCTQASDLKPQFAQTFVVKYRGQGDITAWTASQVVNGAGAYAEVTVRDEKYLVLVMAKAARFENAAMNIKGGVEQLPGNPKVEWVRPLTRRLQRLLGWGDVASARADVVRATEAGDVNELVELLPQARCMIEAGEMDQLPALHDALRGETLALEDCKHEFFQEICLKRAFGTLADVRGPCHNGPMTLAAHRPPFTRCQICRLVLCLNCGKEAEAKVKDDKDLQYALHEARDQHVWSERSNPKALCTRCEVNQPYECACGAQRCQSCMRPPPKSPDAAQCTWRQHPTRPLPFYVIDQTKVSEKDKLAWIRQEIGHEACLRDFAAKFVELFGDKLHGMVPQKNACIKLYSQYVPEEGEARNWKKESDLPPAVREVFQRAWGGTARLCRECARPIKQGSSASQSLRGSCYCSAGCEQAGLTFACRKCNNVLKDNVPPYCTDCNACQPRKRPADQEGCSITPYLQRNWDGLALLERVFFCNRQLYPDHTPAWKERRRS